MTAEARQFDDYELHSPPFTAADGRTLAERLYGRGGEAVELGSHQDRNFLIIGGDGARAVLKIGNPHFGRPSLEMQNAAMHHLATAALPFETPLPLASLAGAEIEAVDRDGVVYDVRLVTYIEGEPFTAAQHLSAPVRERLGRTAAAAAAALAGFDHPAAGRVLQWDVQHARAVVDGLLRHVGDPDRRALAETAMAAHDLALGRLAGSLRRQVIHGDVTDYNVIGRRDAAGRLQPAGLIDFGDMTRTYLVGEAAVTAAAVAGREPAAALAAICDVARGFDAVLALTDEELAALFPLVLGRQAASAVSTDQQAGLDPDNDYATALIDVDWATLDTVAAIPPALAEAAVRAACGRDPHPRGRRVTELLRGASPPIDGSAAAGMVDLGAASGRFAHGEWRTAEGIAAVFPGGIRLGRWGEGRPTHGEGAGMREPATVHLGADVFCPAGTAVSTPLGGTVERTGDRELVLRHELDDGPIWIRIAAVDPAVEQGAELLAGQQVGTVAAAAALPPHAHVQLCTAPVERLPGTAPGSLADAWLALCPDPSPLLGQAVAAGRRHASELRRRRDLVVAGAQHLYYRRPPEIVRGWRQHLYDADGRAYLDMVNNVAILGHSHPAVAEAAHRQMRLLNTNSRFLYESMAAFAERLTARVPAPLERVFLVNSGSEANDLALRLARAFTGRDDVIAVEGAYHGWTAATFAVSTSPVDNPQAATSPPPGLHVVPQANTYRGPHGAGDPEAGARYARHVLEACRSAEAGGGVAAFICEPQLGNTGGLLAPDGYLQAAFAHVRAAGGVCIADEVQVGYGRLGHWFWAFEQQGAVPDILTIAKSTGNGHPVGAVITTAEIADAFGEAGFFSSVGGGPVSCEVGSAVLDAIRDERLQENAVATGERLRTALVALGGRHPLVGAVHGAGLYLGVELVRDRSTKEPAAAEADAVCERMLELGVIVQPTGDHMNVLKVKPPLCITPADADLFAEALDRVLTEGW
ncbi:MAG: aminotransferase [Gaiellales bacterium]|jgi:4-aminobutyrate aminotransferase-like enzyme/Ser/Thr protein kinase RdoA (MazF antagonist)|nr:aminotransferase [Gaiellales bacterium]